MDTRWMPAQRDRLFLVETLMPDKEDREGAAERLAMDAPLLEAMLDDERLYERLMAREGGLLAVSPRLLFTVLLRRARCDLQRETFTVERRDRQKVPLFDADRVVKLLAQDRVREYLAAMLASFTRIESATVPVRVKPGVWRRYRTNDLDVDSLVRYCGALEESRRFGPYRRIGDACLFLAGLFPEYIDAQYRYPMSRQVRPRARGRLCASLDDYEAHGQTFYRRAAGHERAREAGLDGVLATLADQFILAEKPLTFLAHRYLHFTRHQLFGV